jgi:hypothetical protein
MERCSWLNFEPPTSFIRPGDEVPEPEDEGAVVNQRRAEKIQRLVQLYSAMNLTGTSGLVPRPTGAHKVEEKSHRVHAGVG